MDRVFLDANVLFSAAYRAHTRLVELWQSSDLELLTSSYAIEEAQRNLDDPVQRSRLTVLVDPLTVVFGLAPFPVDVSLPPKDRPILQAAIFAHATHLLTGDKEHFGKLFERRVAGVLILPPAAFLLRC